MDLFIFLKRKDNNTYFSGGYVLLKIELCMSVGCFIKTFTDNQSHQLDDLKQFLYKFFTTDVFYLTKCRKYFLLFWIRISSKHCHYHNDKIKTVMIPRSYTQWMYYLSLKKLLWALVVFFWWKIKKKVTALIFDWNFQENYWRQSLLIPFH